MPHTTVAIHVERIKDAQMFSLNAWMNVWLSVQREGGSGDFGPAPRLCPQLPPEVPLLQWNLVCCSPTPIPSFLSSVVYETVHHRSRMWPKPDQSQRPLTLSIRIGPMSGHPTLPEPIRTFRRCGSGAERERQGECLFPFPIKMRADASRDHLSLPTEQVPFLKRH